MTHKYYAVVDRALSSLTRAHDTAIIAVSYEVPTTSSRPTVGNYEMKYSSPYAIAESIEAEQQIYETPCEDEPAGPVYCKPPSDELKIYEEFEGKRFRKVFHKEIL